MTEKKDSEASPSKPAWTKAQLLEQHKRANKRARELGKELGKPKSYWQEREHVAFVRWSEQTERPDVEWFVNRAFENDRHEQKRSARRQEDYDDSTTHSSEPSPEELIAREQELSRLRPHLNAYAERIGVSPEAALAQFDSNKITYDRGRLRKSGHYFEDEKAGALQAVHEKCLAEFKHWTGMDWSEADKQLIDELKANYEQATSKAEPEKIIDELKRAIDRALKFIENVPTFENDEGTFRHTSTPAERTLCAIEKPLREIVVPTLKRTEELHELLRNGVFGAASEREPEESFFYEFVRRFSEAPSKPNARQIAWAWILSEGDLGKGAWAPEGETVASLIEACVNKVRKSIKRQDCAWLGLTPEEELKRAREGNVQAPTAESGGDWNRPPPREPT